MPLSIVEGDLLDQDVDLIVNAWNRNIIPWWLLLPQGVSGAIKKRGGYEPFRQLGYRPMPLGSARLTSAGRLPFRGIVHVAGINMLWRASPESVAACARSAIEVLNDTGYASMAFPIIGAGSGSMDAEVAERALVTALTDIAPAQRILVVRHRPSL